MSKNYINLREWEGVFLRVQFYWLRPKVLGIPYLHGEAFQESQMFAEWVSFGEKGSWICDFSKGYVTFLWKGVWDLVSPK